LTGQHCRVELLAPVSAGFDWATRTFLTLVFDGVQHARVEVGLRVDDDQARFLARRLTRDEVDEGARLLLQPRQEVEDVAVQGPARPRRESQRPDDGHAQLARERGHFRVGPRRESAREGEDLLVLNQAPEIRGRRRGRLGRLDEFQLDLAAVDSAAAVDFFEEGRERRLDRLAYAGQFPPGRHNGPDRDALLRQPRVAVVAHALQVGDEVGHVLARHLVARHRRVEFVARRVQPAREGQLDRALRVGRTPAPARLGHLVGLGQGVPREVRRDDAALRPAAPVEPVAIGTGQRAAGHFNRGVADVGEDFAARGGSALDVNLLAALLLRRQSAGRLLRRGRAGRGEGREQGRADGGGA
jgi:hypothetical protein